MLSLLTKQSFRAPGSARVPRALCGVPPQRFFARVLTAILLITAFIVPPRTHAVASRIKDLVVVAGARDNQLVGYGLVVGLAGDGDKDPVYTVQAVANML